jgi:hypothetical protein
MFGGGEQGVIYGLTDPANMFQDLTGASATTPSGNNGPIGSLKDLSPNGNWSTASDDEERPLSRQGGIPNSYLDPDAFDDRLNVSGLTSIRYIVACVRVPTSSANYSSLCSEGSTDTNNVRLDIALSGVWRAPASSSDANDFSFGGSSTINGVSGAEFTYDTPHVVEMVSASGKAIATILGAVSPLRKGSMDIYRLSMLSRVPSAGERALLLTWHGEAGGLVL